MIATGDLLSANTEALVNAVNCVGVMGKGLALQFREAYPDNYSFYQAACRAGKMRIGKVLVFKTTVEPKYIINFPTKEHWRMRSKLEDIQTGLESLAKEIYSRDIKSIAVPALGCGYGGLRWSDVEPLIRQVLEPLSSRTEILLFGLRRDDNYPFESSGRF